jgi:hypothetical protein
MTGGPLAAVAAAAEAEGGGWAGRLLPAPQRRIETPWAPLCGPRHADGLEAIYEGHLLHHGTPRLFDASDANAALLLGDFLYARGLAWIAEADDTDAIAMLAELITVAARGRAEDGWENDFALWAVTALALADRALAVGLDRGRQDLVETGDTAALEGLLGDRPLGAARAVHAALAAPRTPQAV